MKHGTNSWHQHWWTYFACGRGRDFILTAAWPLRMLYEANLRCTHQASFVQHTQFLAVPLRDIIQQFAYASEHFVNMRFFQNKRWAECDNVAGCAH